MRKIIFFSFVSFFILLHFSSYATHLMGGSITYEYIGQSGSSYQYRITVKVYRYCASGSAELDNSIEVGIYNEDPSNPNADKTRYGTPLTMYLQDSVTIQPPSPGDSCTSLPSVCVQEGTYIEDVYLPASTGGYHIMFERCCRNYNIDNLPFPPPYQGMTYYAFIPPTTYQNNSPVFAEAPVPFICTSDTVSVLNFATDPDGDDLRYSFVHPYRGYSDDFDPLPTPPSTYNWPIPLVTYQGGYDVNNPFGSGGYASINTNTGLTDYYNPTAGFYVVAVQINEYRGAQLIGRTRRDLQLIFIDCPPNPPPNLAPYPDSGKVVTTHNIIEGDSVCIALSYTDQNGDSLFLTSNSLPSGAVLADSKGNGTVTGQFCWNTACDQTGTFNFTVKVTDDGCPPKVTNQVFTIIVNEFTSKNIQGPDTSCANQPNATYTIAGSAGSTYQWTVNGGTQVGGGTSNTITVNWGSISGNFSISAIETSIDGCPSAPVTKNVFLKPSAIVNAGSDLTFCSAASGIFNGDSLSGYTYSWSPSGGLSNFLIANPSVTLTNPGSTLDTNIFIKTATANGCSANDTVLVLVKPLPVSNAGTDIEFCSGDTGKIGTASTAGYTYSWSPSTGLDSTAASNPSVTLTNGTASPQTSVYTVTTTLDGCITTDDVNVIVNPLPTLVPFATPNPICFGDITGISVSGASTYFWTISGNPSDTVSKSGSFNDTLFATTTYIVNGTDAKGCENSTTLIVTVNPLPDIQATSLPDSICIGDTANITATGGVSYSWAYLSSPSVPIGTGINILIKSDTTFSLIVTGTDINNCVNTDTLEVVARPKPATNPIIGAPYACPGVAGVDYYIVDSSGTSGFSWTITGGTITGGQGTDSIKVDWGTSGTGTLSAIETNSYGCEGDPVSMNININVVLLPPAPAGADTICLHPATRSSVIYSVPYFMPGSIYTWHVDTSVANVIANVNEVIVITWDSVSTQNPLRIWYDEVSTTVLDTCYGTSDTLSVYLFPVPNTSSISGDISVCAYDTGILYAVSGEATSYFYWRADTNTNISITGNGKDSVYISWDSAGTYTVQVTETNQFNCDGITRFLTVDVHPLPPPVSITGDDIICSSDTLLAYSVDGLANSTFNWSTVSGTITNGNGTENITLQLGGTGTDTLRMLEQTPFQCFGSLAQKVITLDNQQLQMNAVSDDYPTDSKIEIDWELVDGQYFQGTYYLYRKTNSDGSWELITTVSQDSFTDINVTTKQYIYEYLVKAVNLCGDTVATLYHNKMLLLASAKEGESKFNIYWNRYINWNSGVREYEIWRKKDDEAGYTLVTTTSDSTMEFDDAKTAFRHYFRIRAIDNDGNYQSWSNELVVNFEHQLIIPSAFTPNGDGPNDKWEIKNIDIYPQASVQIFNRWGALVFSAQPYNNDWDGTYNGKDLPDGTYFYVIDVHDEKIKPFTGPVSIIR